MYFVSQKSIGIQKLQLTTLGGHFTVVHTAGERDTKHV